jgi:hypothetical protein
MLEISKSCLTFGVLISKCYKISKSHMNVCVKSRDEMLKHIFLDCGFARECWHLLNLNVPYLDDTLIMS